MADEAPDDDALADEIGADELGAAELAVGELPADGAAPPVEPVAEPAGDTVTEQTESDPPPRPRKPRARRTPASAAPAATVVDDVETSQPAVDPALEGEPAENPKRPRRRTKAAAPDEVPEAVAAPAANGPTSLDGADAAGVLGAPAVPTTGLPAWVDAMTSDEPLAEPESVG